MENNNPKTWSELPLDLVMSVFERLGFADLQRAKLVCSSWYPASRQVVPKNQIPWLILFPKGKNKNNSSCTLFNPEEEDKLYKTQALCVEFANSVCLTTCGSWLLMQDSKYNLYMLNLFTHERIHLPPVESQQLFMGKVERTIDDDFVRTRDNISSLVKGTRMVRTPVFWIDDKTKQYIVLLVLVFGPVVYAKKGDNLWSQLPHIRNALHMVYKDHKLYLFNSFRLFTIYDFSGESPHRIHLHHMLIGDDHLSRPPYLDTWRPVEEKVVVTLTGEILIAERMLKPISRNQSFRICKAYSAGRFIDKNEQVDSLGDEAMIFDLGSTLLANEVDGLKRNSIYFSANRHDTTTKDLFIFNLETRKMELLQKFDFDCSLFELSARWFLPNFSDTFNKTSDTINMSACSSNNG